jgi:RNA polymerase sigma-70 factor (ECF subfamily)
MDEEQAIVQLKQGNINALEFLVNHYYFKAVHSAYLIEQDRTLAEDVVQNIFLDLPKKIKRFNADSAFEPWFFTCVINAAKNIAYKHSRFIPIDGNLGDIESSTNILFQSVDLLPEDQIISVENRQMVWSALSQLNPQQRAVIVMRYYLQMDEDEMVIELDSPRSSIKWWLHKAKDLLRVKLYPLKPEKRIPSSAHDCHEKKE